MRGKSRANVLDEYRRIQLELRAEYDRFTAVHCATCATPCCRRPSRILPTDVLLALSTGWKGHVDALGGRDPVAHAASQAVQMVVGPGDDPPDLPCEYLGDHGCTFPRGLRPYGCTAWVCPPMFAHMEPRRLARVRRLVRELTRAHEALQAQLHRGGGP